MAAVLLDARLQEAGIDARVFSAGLLEGGRPAWPDAAAVLGKRGLDLSEHVSTQLAPADVDDTDLVLGMAREHVREAVALDEAAYPRSFTLKELVRRGEASPRRNEPLEKWLEELSADRSPRDLLGASPDDDVADPIGGSLRKFRATADELDDLVSRLVGVAWPPSRRRA
jgi:protein-tyrosine phosphatase